MEYESLCMETTIGNWRANGVILFCDADADWIIWVSRARLRVVSTVHRAFGKTNTHYCYLSLTNRGRYNKQWMGWMRWHDFAGGEMTNWGAHGVDQIQWALGMDDTGPIEITPLTEGRSGQVRMTYANGVQVNYVIEPGKGPMGGAIFVCEKGKLEINRNKFSSNPPEIAQQLLKSLDIEEEERKWSDSLALWQAKWHMQNWIDCIRSRKLPVADVEIGHRSVSVCHLANIARTAGHTLHWDPKNEVFLSDDPANRLLTRKRRPGFELPDIG